MTDRPDQHSETAPRRRHRGEHEPGPGTVPAADLLAGLAGEPGDGDPAGESVEHPSPEAEPELAPDAEPEPAPDAEPEPAPETGPETEPEPAPVLAAAGLGLHTGRGWVFRDVDLELAPKQVTAVVGAAGSGRSSLLLALTGRMRVTDGTLAVAGRSAIADPRAARQRTAVARLADLIVPEGRLTVDESVTERCLIDAVRPSRGHDSFRQVCEQMAAVFDGAVLVDELAPHEQAILALALAAIRRCDVIVLDDTDRGVTADGEREIYCAAQRLAASGPAIVTTTTRIEAIPDGVVTVDLHPDTPVTVTSEDER